jgi:hypothetical protein
MMRRAVASASFLLRKKENMARTLGMHTGYKAERPDRQRKAPGEAEFSTGALAFPGNQGDRWGNAAYIISAVVFLFQPSKRGAER